MLLNGKEVEYNPVQAASIQKDLNKASEVSSDLQSGDDPKKVTRDDSHEDIMAFSDDLNMDEELRNRKQRYRIYREMSAQEFIHRGLEIIADDSTQSNNDGNVLRVYGDEEKTNLLEDLFYERVDMNYELWSIVYETAKMGDNFYEVVPDNYKKPKKIIALLYREPEKIERIEKDGRLLYYKYTAEMASDKGKKFVDQKVEYKLQPWQIIHFKFEDKDSKPYGGSQLKSGVRTYRRLSLLEDVLLIYRISRAPERRVFYVDVGGLSPSEAKQYVNRLKNIYRSESFIDDNGNINKKANIMSINTDIIVPRREGQGTTIDSLPGGSALSQVEDLKYWKDKILRTMNIPASYMGDESNRAQNLCLAPETKIKLADGRNLSIKEISEEYESGKQNYVYSINENMEWVIKPISWAGITRKNAETIKVTLDNGEEVICTPDHKFMLRDGSYKEAQFLDEGASLMPIYTKYSSKENKERLDGYEMLLNNKNGKWEFTHRIAKKDEIIEEKENGTMKTTVHHVDINKLNNNLDNLVLMDSKEHWKLHSNLTKGLWKKEDYRKKMCKRGFIEESEILNGVKEIESDKLENVSTFLKINRQTLRFIVQDFGYKDWIDFIESNFEKYKSYRNYKHIELENIISNIKTPNEKMETVANRIGVLAYKIIDIIKSSGYKNWFEFITLNYDKNEIEKLNTLNVEEARKELNCSRVTLTKKMKLLGYNGWGEYRNHKVVAVESYQTLEETYDITVDDETPNFALSSGVVVHNSALDQKFGRFIERIQSQIIQGIYKIAVLELFFNGYKKDELKDFTIELTAPSNVKELTDLDLINNKMSIIGTIKGLELFSDKWILSNILKMTEKEIADLQMEKTLEAQQAQAQGQQPEAGGEGGEMFQGGELPAPPEGGGEAAAPEGGEEAAPEGGGEATPEGGGEEVNASTIVDVLGKQFLIENKDDFFKLMKEVKKSNNKKDNFFAEQLSNLIMKNERKENQKLYEDSTGEVVVKSRNINNPYKKFVALNELGGIEYEDGKRKIALYEKESDNEEKYLID